MPSDKHKADKHGRRYDWSSIFGKKEITLHRDKDYNGLEHSFVVYIRRAARRYGYKVSTSVGDKSVRVVVVKKCRPVHNEW